MFLCSAKENTREMAPHCKPEVFEQISALYKIQNDNNQGCSTLAQEGILFGFY